MCSSRSRKVWLLASCLLVLVASNSATAKKPPGDDPPVAPIAYQVNWLSGIEGYTWTYANDVNVNGIIVGEARNAACASRAVCWWFDPSIGELGDWVVEDLSVLMGLDPNEGYLCGAHCISNAELIAGCYKDADGGQLCVCNLVAGTISKVDFNAPFSIRDMNDYGTVVGYITNEADVQQGFAWNPEKGLLLLPEGYLVSGISVVYDADLDVEVEVIVGVICELDSNMTSGEVFTWVVNWDGFDSADNPLGAGAQLFSPYAGRPAINNDGTIAASISGRKWMEPSRNEFSGTPDTWERLGEKGLINDINLQGQVCGTYLAKTKGPLHFSPGFVASRDGFWPLDDRIVFDETDVWWTGGTTLPRAVADDSGDPLDGGFGIVVGWFTGDDGSDRSFALVPVLR